MIIGRRGKYERGTPGSDRIAETDQLVQAVFGNAVLSGVSDRLDETSHHTKHFTLRLRFRFRLVKAIQVSPSGRSRKEGEVELI